jgi:UDP-glucose-4-epimerase GalE
LPNKASKTVFVTGGAGYLGSHCCKLLAAHGYCPVTYDDMSSGRPEFVRYGPKVEGDILDGAALDAALQEYQPKIVFHLAALTDAEESNLEPTLYYDVNSCGTLALLEKCKEHGIEQFVFSSTAAVYGNPSDKQVTISTPVEPINPFGWSKLMSEKFLNDCAADAEIGVTILRYFNVSGADPDAALGMSFDNQTHLIPRLIEAAAKGTPFSIFGNDYDTQDGTCVRDFIHVWDVAAAHIAAIKSPVELGRVRKFNIGLGRGNSVMEVLDSVERITGSKIDVQVKGRRSGDVTELVIGDSKEVANALGWKAEFTEIDDIVRHVWNWYCNRD